MPFAIVHRDRVTAALLPDAPLWRTCLRDVLFFDTLEAPACDGEWLVEGDAYGVLLEIVSGLHSPLVGETQVLGQFKAFLSTLPPDHTWLDRVGQRVLTDARDVRAKHLQGLGSRSYGSAVRRYLSDVAHVALIGTGQLADELLPFLADGRSVDLWGRADAAPTSRAVPAIYRRLTDVSPGARSSAPAMLVIAAPAEMTAIERVAGCYPGLRGVIDLRAEADGLPVSLGLPTTTLRELFDQMGAASQAASRQLEAARDDIAIHSRRFAHRDELRPFGWDDLCA